MECEYKVQSGYFSLSVVCMSLFLRVLSFIATILLFFSSPVFADDIGNDLSPQTYAAQEATVSAHNYGKTLCQTKGYHCVAVNPGDTWYSLFPDYQQREMVMRLNRTNVALEYRNWLVVPDNLSTTAYMTLSPLPQHYNTHHQKLLLVNLRLFAFGAYDAKGDLIYWGPVSSGADSCGFDERSCKTKPGKFRIFRMGGADCYSNEFPLETSGGAPMPYCMFFHGGSALHGSTLSGFINRSSGCVRLFDSDAKWLSERFAEKGLRVIVEG